jgi:two-component system sensor histidine kinase CpxA
MSLARKVFLLALLNILLLAAVTAAIARFQFGLQAESFLLAPVHDRLSVLGNNFSMDYESTGPGQREKLIADWSRKMAADVFIATPRGEWVAGPEVEMPPRVREQMRRIVPPPQREPPPPFGAPPPRREMPAESVFLVITDRPTRYWAGVRIPLRSFENGEPRPGILLFRSDSLFNRNLFFDWRLWAGAVAGAIAISVLCWLPFLRGLTNSIAGLDRATREMAQGNFEVRVDHRRGDEVGDLGAQISRLGTQLGSFVRNQKRFLGDIAHELCAPLARIQFALGILEQKSDDTLRPTSPCCTMRCRKCRLW